VPHIGVVRRITTDDCDVRRDVTPTPLIVPLVTAAA
jgi:hypothetical protein